LRDVGVLERETVGGQLRGVGGEWMWGVN